MQSTLTKHQRGWLTRSARNAGVSVAEYQRYAAAGYKCCTRCKRWKKAILREFKPDPKGTSGVTGACRECLKPRLAELGRESYRRKHPPLKKRFGPLPALPPLPYEPPILPGTAYARTMRAKHF